MYCPNCGAADQKENTYCRQCGEYLPFLDVEKRRQTYTPADQFRLSLVFNLLSAIAGISTAIALFIVHVGQENVHPVIYAVTSLFLVMSIWQIVSFFNNLKLRERFIRREEEGKESAEKEVAAKETNELLPEANLSQNIPASVTDRTTRILQEEASPHAEKKPD